MELSNHVQDWLTWVVLNVLIGVFTPMAGMGLMAAVNTLTANSKNKSGFLIDYVLPYRDGQLGYVAMSWCAAALIELFRAMVKQPHWLMGIGIALIGLLAAANAFIAALGASAPAAELAKPHTWADAWNYYPGLRYSAWGTGAALIGSGVIHYLTMPILGG